MSSRWRFLPPCLLLLATLGVPVVAAPAAEPAVAGAPAERHGPQVRGANSLADQLDRAAREGLLEPDAGPTGAPGAGGQGSFEGARLRYRVIQ